MGLCARNQQTMQRTGRCKMALQLHMWQLPPLMCLAGLLLSDFCRGDHMVHIQEGPLYRVKGYPISISCDVTGYEGHKAQAFAFSVYRPDYPEREIRMIHTEDPGYAYAKFTQRVRKKDIEIERLSNISVRLHFKSLLAEDPGTYECFTPNQLSTYKGTYSAKTTLNVIEDTLTASYSGPASHSISQGESLQLECEVSSQTMQHTHLSVTWFRRTSSETHPIISLDRDLTVRPGEQFKNLYMSGFISIEKAEDTTYRLKMSQVLQSASGEIYCQAEEWIQDPDRSWIRIAYKNSTVSIVEVKTTEVTEVGSFASNIDIASATLHEGEKAVIRCSIQAQNLPGHFFSTAWLKNNIEVAHFGPSGVLTVANDYKGRENEGELRAVKISDKVYILTIQPVRAEDQGSYQCRATQERRTDAGEFTKGQSQLSQAETVSIRAKESGLAVVMTMEQLKVTEGETLKLTCRVSGASGPLSVSWQHQKTNGLSFKNFISLSREGVMVGGDGVQYQNRTVRAFRSTAADFTLEIRGTVVSDSGQYKCTVSEWNMDSSGSMKEVNSVSQQAKVSVNSIDDVLRVSLKSRDTNVTENSLVSLICTVRGAKVSFDVHWKFQPDASKDQKDIVCLLRDGVVSCGKEQKDYQLEVQVQESSTLCILRVLRASIRNQGLYQCQITAYQENIQKAHKRSSLLAVSVHRPVSNLSISISPAPRLDVPVKSNAKIDCLVEATVSNSSRFAVKWMSGTQTLVEMDPLGVVTLGPGTSHEMDQRINMRKTERQTFQLTIQQARSTDNGQYSCSVEEWIQDPDGVWYHLNTGSVTTELGVNEEASDFNLDKSDGQLVVTEGQRVDLNCSLLSTGLDSTFRYSVTWTFERQENNPATTKLLTYSHEGHLQFQDDDTELQQRLHFSRPTESMFRLSILNSVPSDSGRYRCQVDQYQLDCKGKSEWKAGMKSGFTNVSVRFIEIEGKLQLEKVNYSRNIMDRRAGFTVECKISSRSSDETHFEVTWSRSQKEAQPMTIFTAKRDGTLHSDLSDRPLLYSHPSASLYKLTVPDVGPFDSGQYHCQIAEWLKAADSWRKVAEDKSGELNIYVVTEGKPRTERLVVENRFSHLEPTEGDHFDVSCSIAADNENATIRYTLTWLLVKQGSDGRTTLLRRTNDGHLLYPSEDPQLNSRLQFSSSAVRTFHLTVFNSLPSDSGRYQCMVEQYQLGCDGKWTEKGSGISRFTMVTVQKMESKLQLHIEHKIVNITDHSNFTVECGISSRSSDKSAFEVTWFRSQEDGSSLKIFTVNPDGTFHSSIIDRNLVYQHPSATVYKLTVPGADSRDNGQYYCQVAEMLQTPNKSWRELAKTKSGEITVHVEARFHEASRDCHSGTTLGIFIPLICLLLLVIGLLLLKVQRTKSASKKQKDHMWAENNPLKPVPEIECVDA